MNTKKALINCLCGMKRKAHGAQEPKHIQKYVEVTSTAQRGDSPAQAINQRFPNGSILFIRDSTSFVYRGGKPPLKKRGASSSTPNILFYSAC